MGLEWIRTCTVGEEASIEALARRLALPADVHLVYLDRLRDPAGIASLIEASPEGVLVAWHPDATEAAPTLAASRLKDAVLAGARRIVLPRAMLEEGALDRVLDHPGAWERAVADWRTCWYAGGKVLNRAYGKQRPRVWLDLRIPVDRDPFHVLSQFDSPPSDGVFMRIRVAAGTDLERVRRAGQVACRAGVAFLPEGPLAPLVTQAPRCFRANFAPVPPGSEGRRLLEPPQAIRGAGGMEVLPVVGQDPEACVFLAARLNDAFERRAIPWNVVALPGCPRHVALEALPQVGWAMVEAATDPNACRVTGDEECTPVVVTVDPRMSLRRIAAALRCAGVLDQGQPGSLRPRPGHPPRVQACLQMMTAALGGSLFRWPQPLDRPMGLLFQAMRTLGLPAWNQDGFAHVRGPSSGDASREVPTLWCGDCAEVVPFVALLSQHHAGSPMTLDGSDGLRAADWSDLRTALQRCGIASRPVGDTPGLPLGVNHLPFGSKFAFDPDRPDVRDLRDGQVVGALVASSAARPGGRRIRVGPAQLGDPFVASAVQMLAVQGRAVVEGDEVVVKGLSPRPPRDPGIVLDITPALKARLARED